MSIPLGSLRALQGGLLPDTATIARYTETSTADGVVQDWQTIASDIPCRVSPLASSALERAGEGAVARAFSEWTVWLPALTDVTVRDRITVDGADRPDARLFEAQRIGERSYETVREVLCALVT